MKNIKISMFNLFKPKVYTQDRIAPELFEKMLEGCRTKGERKTLYKQANSLPKDIFIHSIEQNKDQIIYESENMSLSGKDFKEFIKSMIGTFVKYSTKDNQNRFIQQKISDEILIPPDKNTMSAICKKFNNKF